MPLVWRIMRGMKSMHSANVVNRPPRRTGRTGSPDPPRIATSIYPPPPLRQRLEGELLIRNSRDGATAWSLSAVIVDILLHHFGMHHE